MKKAAPAAGFFGRFQAGVRARVLRGCATGYADRLEAAVCTCAGRSSCVFFAGVSAVHAVAADRRAGLLPDGRRGSVPPPHARPHGDAHRGNGQLADQVERSSARRSPPTSLTTSSTTSACPTAASNVLFQFRYHRHGRRGHPRFAQPGHKAHRRLSTPVARRAAEGISRHVFSFQPADIVSQILNFGLPAPIDIQFVGTKVQDNLAAPGSPASSAKCPARSSPRAAGLRRAAFQINMDRSQAEQVGITPAISRRVCSSPSAAASRPRRPFSWTRKTASATTSPPRRRSTASNR